MKSSFFQKTVLVLIFILIIIAAFSYGVYSAKHRSFPYEVLRSFYFQTQKPTSANAESLSKGSWHLARNSRSSQGLTAEQEAALTKISALPYLKGYQPAPEITNVTIYNQDSAYDGFNLLLSGHAAEAALTDMLGNTLHKWQKNFADAWPGQTETDWQNWENTERLIDEMKLYKTFWNRVYLFDNGDLLAIFRDYGLIKLDKNSNLLWSVKGRFHHDLSVNSDGNIYILSRETKDKPELELDSWRAQSPIWEDFVVVLNAEGEELQRVSVIDCFLSSRFAAMLEHIKVQGNILHTNAVKIIESAYSEQQPMFKKGNVLISLREIHAIAVIDLQQEKVTWGATGMWKYQHEPTLLANGNILLFDNRGEKDRSRIIEFNPLSQEIVWSYQGRPEEKFYSKTAGTTSRLLNGNTLITESNNGRTFEVTPEAEIVWEYINPNRAGQEDELIAALYDVIRLPQKQVTWLSNSNNN